MLVCEAKGYPHPDIRWHHDSNEIRNGQHHRIYSNGTLHIDGTQTRDQGSYRCTATNSLGTMFADASVSVMGKVAHGYTILFEITTTKVLTIICTNCSKYSKPAIVESEEKNRSG